MREVAQARVIRRWRKEFGLEEVQGVLARVLAERCPAYMDVTVRGVPESLERGVFDAVTAARP